MIFSSRTSGDLVDETGGAGMEKFRKIVETTTNIAIVIVAGTLLTFLFRGGFDRKDTESLQTIKPGQRVTLPSSFQPGSRTLILVLSNSCHFCTESAPFYQEIQEKTASRRDVRLVAVLPQAISEGKAYLEQLGIAPVEALSTPLSSIPVRATPTLVLVNPSGVVTDVWVGKLEPARQKDVVSKLGM